MYYFAKDYYYVTPALTLRKTLLKSMFGITVKDLFVKERTEWYFCYLYLNIAFAIYTLLVLVWH